MKLLAALLLLSGCYLEHVAEPCDAGDETTNAAAPLEPEEQSTGRVAPSDIGASNCEGGVIVAYYGCTRPGDPYWKKYCEGPFVGCIAPGSPFSSTGDNR